MQNVKMKKAIALIELIFAIVVMGIALMSAPMLLSTAAKSTNVALQQEGINEAVSQMNLILTYPWDQNDTGTSCIPPVLHVANGDSELDEASNDRRVGVPLTSSSRTFNCNGKEYSAGPIGQEGSVIDDIDDFNGKNYSLVVESSGSGGTDYIEKSTVKIATTVSYIGDTATYASKSFSYAPQGGSGASTNIKKIRVTLTSTSGVQELQKTITFNAFSCNVGGIAFERRTF